MHITSEKDITGQAAKYLREQANLTQKAFWNSVGLTQSGGCRYEQGQSIPRPIRILIYTIYAAGIRIDATSEAGTSELQRLAKLQASERAADKEVIGEKIVQAQSHLNRAAGLIAGLSN